LRSEDDDSDLWSIISDILRFFKMGFLCKNEFDFEILLLAGDVDGINDLSDPVCSGPYNQVTSQSLSLLIISYVPGNAGYA
jgi:hypothetical protein